MAEWQPSGPEPGEEHHDFPRDPAGGIIAAIACGPAIDVIILTAAASAASRS